jgi:clan AA aspartic protease (TIGR02281 family)
MIARNDDATRATGQPFRTKTAVCILGAAVFGALAVTPGNAQPACGNGSLHVGESCRQPDGTICSIRGYHIAGTFEAACAAPQGAKRQQTTRPFDGPESCGTSTTHSRNVELCTSALAEPSRREEGRHWLLISRGFSNLGLNKRDLARADFDEAIRLKPDDPNAYAFLGLLEVLAGSTTLDKAIEAATKAIEIDPNYAFGFAVRAAALTRKREHDAAIADAEVALRLNPKLRFALSTRGSARREKGDTAAAIADFSEAIQMAPLDPAAYSMRAAAYVKNGDFALAIDDYSQSLALRPDQIAVLLARGQAFAAKGETDRARYDYQRALDLPAEQAGRQLQARARSLLAQLGNDRRATSASKPGENPVLSQEPSATVLAGTRTRIASHYFLERDCTSPGIPRIQIKVVPANGKVEALAGEGFPNFPTKNPRVACNSQKSQQAQLWYTANKGFVGTDSIEYQVFNPNGTTRHFVTRIKVDPDTAAVSRTEEIAIERPGRIEVQVSVNGVSGKFLLDTGASYVSVTQAFASKARISYNRNATVTMNTANGPAKSHPGRAERIQLRSLQAMDVMVVVQGNGRAGYGPGIDGLLGLSFLSRFDLTISDKLVRIAARSR